MANQFISREAMFLLMTFYSFALTLSSEAYLQYMLHFLVCSLFYGFLQGHLSINHSTGAEGNPQMVLGAQLINTGMLLSSLW